MKRVVAIIGMLALTVAAFGLGNRQGMTEEEALALIDQKVMELKLTLEEGEASKEALKAIVQAGARVQEALKIINQALDDGLRVQEMNEIALRMRSMAGEGLSEGNCEDAARNMVQLMVQERLRAEEGDGEGTKTQKAESAGPGPAANETGAGKP